MKKLYKNFVIATITIRVLLVTTYGAIMCFLLFGLLGTIAWLFSVAVIVLTLAETFLEDACSKAHKWIDR